MCPYIAISYPSKIKIAAQPLSGRHKSVMCPPGINVKGMSTAIIEQARTYGVLQAPTHRLSRQAQHSSYFPA